MGQSHILIVDDEQDLRELLVQMLDMDGLNISQASNGRAALEIFKKENIDLVISDVRMPGGDGVELLKAIRTMHPKLPQIIMMTGFSDASDEEMLSFGANAVFTKPFDTERFSEAVRNALELRKKEEPK